MPFAMAAVPGALTARSSFLSGEALRPEPSTSLAQLPRRHSLRASASPQDQPLHADIRGLAESAQSNRRVLLAASLLTAAGAPALAQLVAPPAAGAIIPSTALAGRVPGLSEPDERGWRTYKRPANKSGGHGIGWSELIPYSFAVPDGWEEVPVSIADLGGTELDLRFKSSTQGTLAVVVAPVLRFSDTLGSNARIEKVGTPEKVINAFGPEITGENVEGKVKDMQVVEKQGLTYYNFELDPHYLISTTAAGNRLYILALQANGRQWKKFQPNLREILTSFYVGEL